MSVNPGTAHTMDSTTLNGPQVAPQHGLAKTAVRGTGLTTIQVVVNKLATVGSMWVVALQLSPDEIGRPCMGPSWLPCTLHRINVIGHRQKDRFAIDHDAAENHDHFALAV
jgi:hypothetical protein